MDSDVLKVILKANILLMDKNVFRLSFDIQSAYLWFIVIKSFENYVFHEIKIRIIIFKLKMI